MCKIITIVEDDPDILFTLKLVLENAGYEVHALSSGRTVLDGQCERSDLFILDKRMPDMDGLDICRHLRTKSESKNLPIIMISASPKFGPEALVAGANAFLEKPFDIKKLRALVSNYLD
jgi:DNA-binding response OmpR family regulator